MIKHDHVFAFNPNRNFEIYYRSFSSCSNVYMFYIELLNFGQSSYDKYLVGTLDSSISFPMTRIGTTITFIGNADTYNKGYGYLEIYREGNNVIVRLTATSINYPAAAFAFAQICWIG